MNGELHRLRNSIAQSNRAYHDRDQDDNEDGGKDGGKDGGEDGGKDRGKDRGKDDGPAPMGPAREASLRLGTSRPGEGEPVPRAFTRMLVKGDEFAGENAPGPEAGGGNHFDGEILRSPRFEFLTVPLFLDTLF